MVTSALALGVALGVLFVAQNLTSVNIGVTAAEVATEFTANFTTISFCAFLGTFDRGEGFLVLTVAFRLAVKCTLSVVCVSLLALGGALDHVMSAVGLCSVPATHLAFGASGACLYVAFTL